MRLIVVHQILITSAIALAALFGVRALIVFARGEGSVNLVMAILAGAIGAALSVYLRSVRRKAAEEKRAPLRR